MINIREIESRNQTTYKVTIDEWANTSRSFKVTHNVGNPPISVVHTQSGRVIDYDSNRSKANRKAYACALEFATEKKRYYGNWLTINSVTSFTRPSRRSKLERMQLFG